MTQEEKSKLLMSAYQDATIYAAAHNAYEVLYIKGDGESIIRRLLILFANFNRYRNEEIATLRAEVIRLRSLIVEPIQIGTIDR